MLSLQYKQTSDYVGFNILAIIAPAYFLLTANLGRYYEDINFNPIEKSLFLVLALVLIYRRGVKPNLTIIFSFIALIPFVFGLFSQFGDFSWFVLMSSLIGLMAFLLLHIAKITIFERILILQFSAWLAVSKVLFGLLMSLFTDVHIFHVDFTGSARLSVGAGAAHLAASAVCSTISALYLFWSFRSRIYLLLCLTSVVICFLTATRMASLILILSIILIIFQCRGQIFNKLFLVLLSLFFVVSFMFLFGSSLLDRIEFGSNSGRDVLFEYLFSWLTEYPYAGVGFGHQPLLLPENLIKSVGTIAAHNEYLRYAVELGFIGSAFFLIILFIFFTASIFSNYCNSKIWSVMLVLIFFLYALYDNVFVLPYTLLALLSLSYGAGLIDEINI